MDARLLMRGRWHRAPENATGIEGFLPNLCVVLDAAERVGLMIGFLHRT